MNKNKCFFSGFTLVEVMIAVSLLSGLSLVIMNINKQQSKTQRQAETNFEVNTIYSAISQNLLNSQACINTLAPVASIANGSTLSQIKDRNNTALFNVGTLYGTNKVKLLSMTIKGLIFNPTPSSTTKGYGTGNIEIALERVGVVANATITRNIPLSIEVNNSYVVTKCYSSVENAVDTAKISACQNISGVYDAATDSCNLANFPATINDRTAVSTNYLQNFLNTTVTGLFVKKTGDTMTGTLTGTTVNANSFCISGNCRTNFTLQDCGVGKVISKLNSDGSTICSNVTCPDPATFFVGVNAAGSPICKPFPTNTCTTNQYVSKVNTDGSVVCSNLPPNSATTCSAGQVIQSIDANGTPSCVAYHPKDMRNFACPAGQAVTSIDSAGQPQCTAISNNFTCPAGQALTAMTNGIPTCASTGITTRIASSSTVAWRWATATAYCNADEIRTGGGGSCTGGSGFNFIYASQPAANGWYIACDTPQNQNNQASVYAVCVK